MIREYRSGAHAARRLISTYNAAPKYTTLSKGVTVTTESNPHAHSAAIGVFYGAGSRAENPYNNGVGALSASLLGQGMKDGVFLSSYATKEVNGVLAQSINANAAAAAKTVSSLVSSYAEVVEKADISAAKAAQIAKIDALEKTPSASVSEHLNTSAFQGHSLGLPTLGSYESVSNLELADASRFLESHLLSDNVVISASGNIEHDAIVEAVESSLKVAPGYKSAAPAAPFLGSEVRLRDDTLGKAYISIAAQGEGLSSPARYVAQVAAAIFGDFDCRSAVAKFSSPKLASIVQDYHIVDKYTHFSTAYSDTGLWGFNAEISNLLQIDDFVHFTLKEWNRLTVSITDAEVARGKAAAKVAFLGGLNSPAAICTEVANKVLLSGFKASVEQDLAAIDAITTKDVKAWASAALWDKDVVIAGIGSIEGLLDYNRIRNDMAMMRF